MGAIRKLIIAMACWALNSTGAHIFLAHTYVEILFSEKNRADVVNRTPS